MTSVWARWLPFLPGALLVAVACHQIVLAHTCGLAAWSGGGFGMFASTDAGATRHLHAYVRRPGLRREVRPSREHEKLAQSALTLPSESNLRRLAAALAELPTADHGPASEVEIQVWHTRFDPESLVPNSRILRAIEVSLGPR
jgi:hypothetical protein